MQADERSATHRFALWSPMQPRDRRKKVQRRDLQPTACAGGRQPQRSAPATAGTHVSCRRHPCRVRGRSGNMHEAVARRKGLDDA